MQITLDLSDKTVDVLERFIVAVKDLQGSPLAGGFDSPRSEGTEVEASSADGFLSAGAGSEDETKPAKETKAKSSKAKKADKKPASKKADQPDLAAIKDAIKESELSKESIIELLKGKFEAEKVTDIPKERWSEFIVELGVAV